LFCALAPSMAIAVKARRIVLLIVVFPKL